MAIVVIGTSFVDLKGFPDNVYIPKGRNAGRVEIIHGGVGRNVVEDIANVELEPKFVSLIDKSEMGKAVIDFATQFVGNPYVYGGTSLTNGADCSGFTMAVYQNFGYSLPRSSTSQRSAGTGVTYAEAQPGDLICYSGHVGIYAGNGKIVHASNARTGIIVSDANYRQILAVRRIF